MSNRERSASLRSTATIKLFKTGNYKSRTKNIDVKYHFVREKIDNNIINVNHISSHKIIADILTK